MVPAPVLHSLAALVLAASLTIRLTPARATDGSAAPAADASGVGQAEGEFLVADRPAGWKLGYQGRRGAVSLAAFVPADQDGEGWRDQIAVQVFHDQVAAPPGAYLDRIRQAADAACDRVWFGPAEDKLVNGYATAVMSASCGRNKHSGLGEFTIFKVIRGREATYMVQRAWRIPPGNDPLPLAETELQRGARYLAGVHLCDTRDAAHPCPPGVGAKAPAGKR